MIKGTFCWSLEKPPSGQYIETKRKEAPCIPRPFRKSPPLEHRMQGKPKGGCSPGGLPERNG